MKKTATRIVKLVGFSLVVATPPSTVKAEDVLLYRSVPSVDELRDVLVHSQKPLSKAIVFSTPSEDASPQTAPAAAPAAASSTSKPGRPPAVPASAAHHALPAAASDTPKRKTVGLPILFEINSAEILVKSLPYLNQIGTLLREESALILVIEGHTDANGPSDYNLALSRKRAEAVADYLIGSFAIPPARLRTEGKGESALLRPSSPTHPDNRRVQFYAGS